MPHPHLDGDQSPVEPTYPPLEPPEEFKSQIPEHLFHDISVADRYLMEQMSIMRQQGEWSVRAHLSQDRQLRFTNGKVRKHEGEIKTLQDDKKAVISGWRLIAAIGGILAGIASFLITIYQIINGGGGH